MRSKAYCLFVLLTLVVFNLASDPLFCESADLTKEDCQDKILDAADVKWDFGTAFNNRKHISRENRETVEVDFNRALWLNFPTGFPAPISTGTFSITFTPVKKENCKFVLHRENGNNKELTLDAQNKFTFTVKQGDTVIVAVFDPECRLYAKLTDLEKQDSAKTYYLTAKHIFTRNVQSETWPDQFWKYQVKDKNGQLVDKVKELGNYIVARHDGDDGNVHPEIKERNMFYPFGNRNDSGREECHHLCKEGYLFEFQIAAGLPFANTFKVNKDCQWMTIFLNNAEGNRMAPAEISFRHGFVTLPKEVKAFPMDFETNDATGQHAVTVLYYLDNSAQKMGNLYIANSHGQAVRSDIVLPSTTTIYFEFNDENCLASVIGQEMVQEKFEPLKVGDPQRLFMVMKQHDFKNALNLGFNVIMYDNYRSFSYAKKHGTYDPIKRKGETWTVWGPGYAGDMDAVAPKDVHGGNVNPEINNTPPPQRISDAYTNGYKEQVTAAPGLSNIENEAIEAQEKEKKRRTEELNAVMNYKFYLYWAIPAGFGAGSFASFILCNIIMFVMRRSVCTFWYKAMYKRYGSDTTMGGTTMGKTAGGETIGGGTTAGGTTAGGTTSGGTTAGETVGSTTAA